MKIFKRLLFLLLLTFSFSTSSFAFYNTKNICSDKCDGVIKDGNCVPVTNMYEVSIKDVCIARVKEGARNVGFGLIIMMFLIGFLFSYRVPKFSEENNRKD